MTDLIKFDACQTELEKGINLIEASAGTGKTYTIAMLVLRFVVEQDLAIETILVVTFTIAATEELKDRVHQRLLVAKKVLSGQSDELDPADVSLMSEWLAGLSLEHDVIEQRLNKAISEIDQASIFTIHGFCKRVLREHALESGQLFDAELTDDLASIKQACADDFWRKQIYSRTPWQASVLTMDYKTPDQLLASVKVVSSHVKVYPDYQDINALLARIVDYTITASQTFDTYLASLQAAFDEKFKASYCAEVLPQLPVLTAWLQGDASRIPSLKDFERLSYQGLLNGLDGNKFRKKASLSSEQQKTDYLNQFDTQAFDALYHALIQVSLVLRRALLETLQTEVDQRLQQLNVLSFDHLISRLSEALISAQGKLLANELRKRFFCALIDEFQDTDQEQWSIFSSIFATDNHFLYLIGDPKQAIYKFRGADIYSYLQAQQQAQFRFTLAKNWRSHPKLVNAVNALFQGEQPFLLHDLAFHAVEPAKSADNGELCYQGQAVSPMLLWHLPEQIKKDDAEQSICIAVCNEIVALLMQDYRLEPKHLAIQPKDIAILVRNNEQARDYQKMLREVSVPAVLNSVESVFASPEAQDLYTLLQAIANPSDNNRFKQALSLDWFGFDGHALYALFNDSNALDDYLMRFLSYYQEWQKHGLMAMMQTVFKQEKLAIHLAQTYLVERQLTNIYHLIELIHQAAVAEHLGINKVLDWIQANIIKAKDKSSPSEDQQLRLESDEDAVQIITMHRAKGLEYPIVFCPCLWQYHDYLNKSNLVTCHEQGQTIADLGSDDFAKHLEQARYEQQAEDARLLYVAVTRAKYRCYLVWADVKSALSPLGHLLKLTGEDSEQQAILQNFVTTQPDSFAYRCLETKQALAERYQRKRQFYTLQAKQRQRILYTSWQMSSYTALSALSEHDAPELPEDKAREQNEILIPPAEETELPKGANTGNVVHDLLEHHAFADLALRKDISIARDQACQRYSLKLEHPELIDELLENVVKTPLSNNDDQFCLMHIDDRFCLKELPFYLAIPDEMNVRQINTILHGTPTYQPLTSKVISGYLTGFIDLVCQYQGRFYVMDYKTNYLVDYDHANLTLAMREHNYGLQYWLYCVVLHRYLENRLDNYDYKSHFGGVRYLFVRGMSPETATQGVYQDQPDYERVKLLADLLSNPVT